MARPPQLERGLRERKLSGRTGRRPILEQLPSINCNHIKVPRDYKTYLRDVSLRYGCIVGMRINWHTVEFTHKPLHRTDPAHTEAFKLRQIKTGLGGYFRHVFECSCGRGTVRLYVLHRHLACKRCHRAISASQTLGKRTRPLLQISRIESILAKPRLRNARARLTKKLGQKVLLARALWE